MKSTFPLIVFGIICIFLNGCGDLSPVEGEAAPANLFLAESVSAGDRHSCAVLSDGTVSCWGRNNSGQLGNNSSVNANRASSTVLNLTGASSVSSGGEHTCAVLSTGTISCWGRNSNGQLGNATTSTSLTPVAVSGITSATAVAAGGSHTCALLSDGTVRCWGRNASGQLGDGTNTGSSTPVFVFGITSAVSIAAGGDHSCAVLSNGGVRCWGANTLGQLGNNDNTLANSTTPVIVQGISTATQVAAGGNHSCARLSDGTVRCWGDNSSGQVGTPWPFLGGFFVTISIAPAQVTSLSNATAVTAGLNHSCALFADAIVRCWGDNSLGQLGSGTNIGNTSPGLGAPESITITPVQADVNASVSNVEAGLEHTCARQTNGRVKCWGVGVFGQLGDGTDLSSTVPVEVIK